MVAIIGNSAHEASIAAHRRGGFRTVGVLESVGCKFGRWLDTVIMQRAPRRGRDGAAGRAAATLGTLTRRPLR